MVITCPFFKDYCIKDNCMLWRSFPSLDKNGNPVAFENCSLAVSALAAAYELKEKGIPLQHFNV